MKIAKARKMDVVLKLWLISPLNLSSLFNHVPVPLTCPNQ
jgi:hypothetical protein